jgi:hypothetical protein
VVTWDTGAANEDELRKFVASVWLRSRCRRCRLDGTPAAQCQWQNTQSELKTIRHPQPSDARRSWDKRALAVSQLVEGFVKLSCKAQT